MIKLEPTHLKYLEEIVKVKGSCNKMVNFPCYDCYFNDGNKYTYCNIVSGAKRYEEAKRILNLIWLEENEI